MTDMAIKALSDRRTLGHVTPTPLIGEIPGESGRLTHELRESAPRPRHAKLEVFTGAPSQLYKVVRMAVHKIPTEDAEDVQQDIMVRYCEYPPHSWAGCWAIANSVIARYWERQHPRQEAVSFDTVTHFSEDGEALTLGDVTPSPYNLEAYCIARDILRHIPHAIAEAVKLARQPMPRGNPQGWNVQTRKEAILMARLKVSAWARAEIM